MDEQDGQDKCFPGKFMANILRVVGLLGFLLFGGLMALTFYNAASVEKAAQSFIRYQVEKEIEHKLGLAGALLSMKR